MAPRRRPKQREAQLTFEALSIEGGLLSPEWLAKVAQRQAAHQSEADYRVPKGLNLRDEIGRYWRIAQAHWAELQAGQKAGADPRALAERFALALLRECLGFASLVATAPLEKEGRIYPVGHRALEGRVPVVIAPAGSGLDTLTPAFGDGSRRRSAFGLAQEVLNAHEGALWAIATDAATLRLLRDNASLTRPAWIEADLARIFAEERYADFAALWLLAHETRFGAPGQPVTDCPLEVWRAAGREEGTRAREHLRVGVEEALLALGRGFLVHTENQSLRAALHDGTLTKDAYFQELLRLVYRLIFLLTAEERGVLHPDDAAAEARSLYERGYGLRRLRDRAVRRSAHDRFGDLWGGLKIVLRGVAAGEPRLGLPALGGLFSPNQCPHLDAARLENRALLTAIFKLSWLKEDSGLSRVNWRDMGPEELGSVYESLLELVPVVPESGRGFTFATGAETKGNARKTTGSYYTPDSLVQVLLDSALEPVVKETVAAHPEDAAEALLRLTIVDPACGSGHFLLAAARRIAGHVARLQANGTPSAAQYRHALRQVVSRCVFGVDLNPMAVELCRVGLWMEAVEPGKPLSFLDSHIQCGNALLGTTPELMAKGIPDAAFEPIEGDDRKTASLLKKRNKAAAEGQRGLEALWAKPAESESAEVARAAAELDAAPDADLAAVAGKEARWEEIQASKAYRHQKFVADAWCAAFVWPKPPTEPKTLSPLVAAAPTNDLWRQIRDGQGTTPALTVKIVDEMADQYRFFHWRLAFPQVFARGGFDIVLGNPPWGQVEFKAREFFAERNAEIAKAPTAAAQKKLIEQLGDRDPHLFAEYRAAERRASAERSLLVSSGMNPLCGKGRVNHFTLFAETAVQLVAPREGARVGMILPSGIATDEAAKDFFAEAASSGRLVRMLDFVNGGIFAAVHSAFRFCLFCVAGARWGGKAEYAFGLDGFGDRSEKTFELPDDAFKVLNPNTGTCPIFGGPRDAEITLHVHRKMRVFALDSEPDGGPWRLRTISMPNVADDSAIFRTATELANKGFTPKGHVFTRGGERYVRFYEAKSFTIFDHRAADVVISSTAVSRLGQPAAIDDAGHSDPTRIAVPRHWYPEEDLQEIVRGKWNRKWFIGWRDLTGALNERTLIPAVLPWCCFGRNNIPPLWPGREPGEILSLVAALSSLVVDYIARQKLGGLHMTVSLMRQLPVPGPPELREPALWDRYAPVRGWQGTRALELIYTAWDLEPFARDLGYDGPPFRWDPDRRFLLRAELDAAFLHIYGISRDDADYILETFPIVKKNDEKAHGEYRTKRVILEIYDEMAVAIRTGKPYQTRLDPPPADPRCAHGESSRQALRAKKESRS